MKNLKILASSAAAFSFTSLPAFACNLWAPHLDCPLVQAVIPIIHSAPPPSGAPAPMLASGIPAFLALAGAALATKLFPRRRGAE